MSIKGSKILINPTGGLYHNEQLNRWLFQHEYISGITPDILSMDFANSLSELLEVVGSNAYCTRELNRFNGLGESHQPKWHECSCVHLKNKKIPEAIWENGKDSLEKDLIARPGYAEYIKVDCIVSITFSESEEQGMELWYNNMDAKRLAESIRDSICKIDKKNMKEKFLKEDINGIYPVLSKTQIPSVVISLFNLKNASECWLANQWWEKVKIVTGIFGGIYKTFEI
jgi:hypothetical protein